MIRPPRTGRARCRIPRRIATQCFYLHRSMGMPMYTCWDCQRFGSGCEGRLLKEDLRNDMEKHCRFFRLNTWRRDIYQRSGTPKL